MTDRSLHRANPTADAYYYKQAHQQISQQVQEAGLESDADEYFELQPIEKKLCAYSLGLGLILLAVFILVFEIF